MLYKWKYITKNNLRIYYAQTVIIYAIKLYFYKTLIISK
jgi:hypothetical protein